MQHTFNDPELIEKLNKLTSETYKLAAKAPFAFTKIDALCNRDGCQVWSTSHGLDLLEADEFACRNLGSYPYVSVKKSCLRINLLSPAFHSYSSIDSYKRICQKHIAQTVPLKMVLVPPLKGVMIDAGRYSESKIINTPNLGGMPGFDKPVFEILTKGKDSNGVFAQISNMIDYYRNEGNGILICDSTGMDKALSAFEQSISYCNDNLQKPSDLANHWLKGLWHGQGVLSTGFTSEFRVRFTESVGRPFLDIFDWREKAIPVLLIWIVHRHPAWQSQWRRHILPALREAERSGIMSATVEELLTNIKTRHNTSANLKKIILDAVPFSEILWHAIGEYLATARPHTKWPAYVRTPSCPSDRDELEELYHQWIKESYLGLGDALLDDLPELKLDKS